MVGEWRDPRTKMSTRLEEAEMALCTSEGFYTIGFRFSTRKNPFQTLSSKEFLASLTNDS